MNLKEVNIKCVYDEINESTNTEIAVKIQGFNLFTILTLDYSYNFQSSNHLDNALKAIKEAISKNELKLVEKFIDIMKENS